VVFNSSNVPGLIMDTLTFRTDFIENHPETIKAFLKSYFKAIQYVKDHPQESYNILAKAFKINQDTVKKQLKGIFLLNKKDNETAFSNYQGYWSIYSNLKTVDDYIKHKKGNLTTINSSNLVEPKFNIQETSVEATNTSKGN
jgi:NitT/TauT family transport system substrate-binding protein